MDTRWAVHPVWRAAGSARTATEVGEKRRSAPGAFVRPRYRRRPAPATSGASAASLLPVLLLLLVPLLLAGGCGGPDLSGEYAGTVRLTRGWYEGDTYQVRLALKQDGEDLSGRATMTFDAARSLSDAPGDVRQVVALRGRTREDGSFRLAGGGAAGSYSYDGRGASGSGGLTGNLGISDGYGTSTGPLEADQR